MKIINYINTSINIFSIIVCVIILVYIISIEYKKEKLNIMFISLVMCHIPLLLVDIAIFTLEGSTIPYITFVIRVAYFFSFILGTIMLILFTHYLLTFIEGRATITRGIVYVSRVAVAVCIINIICIILTQFNGMYYIIDSNNVYHFQNWYWLSQFSAFICVALNTGIIIAYRKSYATREMIFLLSYTALPILALVINNIIKGSAVIDFATTLTIVIFYAGIQSEQEKQLKEKELELSEGRISIMLSQIQPNFLYNSLMIINQLCDSDPQKAKEATIEFSNYLRGNLDSLTLRKGIPFIRELEHIRAYLALEQKHFGGNLKVEFDIKAKDFVIPCLTLQPIIEKVIHYDVTKQEHGSMLILKTKETKNVYQLIIETKNIKMNLSETEQSRSNHIDIENIKRRLSFICNGTLEIENTKGVGTIYIITIPK